MSRLNEAVCRVESRTVEEARERSLDVEVARCAARETAQSDDVLNGLAVALEQLDGLEGHMIDTTGGGMSPVRGAVVEAGLDVTEALEARRTELVEESLRETSRRLLEPVSDGGETEEERRL